MRPDRVCAAFQSGGGPWRLRSKPSFDRSHQPGGQLRRTPSPVRRHFNAHAVPVNTCRARTRSRLSSSGKRLEPLSRARGRPGRARMIRSLRQFVSDRAFDLARSLHGGAGHHAIVVVGEIRKHSRCGFERIDETPIQAKQVNVGDRIAPQRPLPLPQSAIGDPVHSCCVLDPKSTCGMERRGAERHPRYGLSLGFKVIIGQQARIGEAFGEIVENCRHFGQRATVDQKRRNLAFRIERKIVGRRCSRLRNDRGRPSKGTPISCKAM
jgi:hypothetical protein